MTVAEPTGLVAFMVCFEGRFRFGPSKPDGTPCERSTRGVFLCWAGDRKSLHATGSSRTTAGSGIIRPTRVAWLRAPAPSAVSKPLASADDGGCADASLNARPAGFDLLGVAVSAVNLSEAVTRIDQLARTRDAGGATYVCVRDVNGIVECQRDEELRQIHRDAALVTPDGMPVVWWGRLCGYRSVDRVYGPDLMTALCARSAASGFRHFLYGGPPGCVEELAAALVARFPGLCLVGSFTPPFRPLSAAERIEVVNCINGSGADIVWVGLSSPQQ